MRMDCRMVAVCLVVFSQVCGCGKKPEVSLIDAVRLDN